ncbi:helicase RepA family protein [Plastoroseomonas hellenica]|uniref:helicase RepA family protein n=1 Tax=Plastoroseomonas hellenica TaxID=2687306 RepID=UPI001BA65D31|nr:helicase RepA family protein [Plastoroseomonas hellenica]MBR0647444.1 AAA family ATPase [Plastoroseomonas hellenica]
MTFADTEDFSAAFAAARRAGPILFPRLGPPAQHPPLPPLPLTWFHEIAPELEAREIVQGLLGEQTAIVVYGASNVGKTFWTTDLALHVAAGRRWCGRRVAQGGVIYCALEGGRGFQNRVTVWKRRHGMEDARIPFAAIRASLNLLEPEADPRRLVDAAREVAARMEMPATLIVIDTLARAFGGGDENGPEDMGALIRNMDMIREATGAAVLFVYHSGKDQARGARGHTSLRAAVDTEIEVTADKEGAGKTATTVKQRDLEKGEGFPFTLKRVELGRNQHGEPVTSCVVEAGTGMLAGGPQRDPEEAALRERIAHLLGPDGQMLARRVCEELGWPVNGRNNARVAGLIPLHPDHAEITIGEQRIRMWRTRDGDRLTAPFKIRRQDLS